MFASERRDSASENTDVEYSGSDDGLPLPHLDIPPLPESHAVQQDEHHQQWRRRALLL